jgi:hypothetical protein
MRPNFQRAGAGQVRRRLLAGAFGWVVGFLLVWGGPATGHTASEFYTSAWERDHTEKYYFRDNVPSGAFRDRVKDGFAEWNDTPNDNDDEPNFIANGEKGDSGGSYLHPCNASYSAVYYKDLGQAVDGFGKFCDVFFSDGPQSYYKIIKFSLTLNADHPWYTGTGDAPDGGPFSDAEPDLWTVSTHEAGHVTGWFGHYDQEGSVDICDDNMEQRTMCRIHYWGTERMRTIEDHDYHTFEAFYPHP